MENHSCYIFNTMADGRMPSDFTGDYHVHILCLAGEMTFSDGRRQYASHRDDLVIWQMSNTIQQVGYSDDFEALVLIVSPDFLTRYNPEMTWATQGFIFIRLNPSYHLAGDSLRLITDDFRQMQLRQSTEGWLFREEVLGRLLQIFLFDLWQVYSASITQMQADDNSSQIFLRFVTLVQQHCRQHRDLGFYADRLCITPKYLSQVSKKVTNIPASEWIAYYATSELVALLNDNGKTLTEIADAMNFSAPSFFSRYVKNVLGVSPTEYRSRQGDKMK